MKNGFNHTCVIFWTISFCLLSHAYTQNMQYNVPFTKSVAKISELTVDPLGYLVISTNDGEILRFDSKVFTKENAEESTGPRLNTRCTTTDIRSGLRYMTCGSEVLKIKDEDVLSSFPIGHPITGLVWWQDAVLISTMRSGIFHIDSQDKLRKWTQEIPGFPQNIYKMKVFEKGIVLLDSYHRLFLWDPVGFTLRAIPYDVESVDGEIIDMEIDDFENIWLASHSKLYKVQTSLSGNQGIPPKLVIDQVKKNKQIIRHADIIPMDKDDLLEATFVGIHHSSLPITYAYRVDAQDEWTDIGTYPKIALTKLPTGNHRLMIRSTVDGYSFSHIEPFDIKVSFGIMGSAWPYLMLAICGILGLWCWSMRRNRRSLAQTVAQRDKIVLENNLLRSKQKTQQLAMNPHFIFNALNGIRGLISMNENSKARKSLSDFSILLRSMLNQSQDDEISIEEEIKYLERYVALEEMSRSMTIRFEVNLATDISVKTKIPSMLIQPIIENAIIHGLAKKKADGHIILSLSMHNGLVRCIIEDNGQGLSSDYSKKESSAATKIIKDRLKMHHRFGKQDYFKIANREDGSGVKVEIIIPKL